MNSSKPILANKTNYAFYDLPPGNGAGPSLTIPDTGASLQLHDSRGSGADVSYR